MNHPLPPFSGILLCVAMPILGSGEGSAASAESRETVARQDSSVDLGIGGCGGAYFLASPGELVIDVYKRDRNRRGRVTELRAILVAPDRRVLDEAVIADDGQPRGSGLGPVRRVRLSAQVERKGVFGLNITVSQDRYGEEIVWGFKTNCPKYLIETSRGHRDERRQEPIVLANPGKPGSVCFMQRRRSFRLDVTDLPADVDPLKVYDADDGLLQTLHRDADGKATFTFPADANRGSRPWRLALASQEATIHIDGVTRWEPTDRYANLPVWTPDPNSWFPLLPYRWLLTPYRRTVHGRPGETDRLQFNVHNNSRHTAIVNLGLEFPGESWPVRLSADRVEVPPKKSVSVTAAFTIPAAGEERICHVRATPANDPEFTTYSTLTVKGGPARASTPLDVPVVLQPYRHENELFGYLPDYPVAGQMYFDLENRPAARRGGVATYHTDQWMSTDMRSALKPFDSTLKGLPVGMTSTKIAFDADNDMYVLGSVGGQPALLHSTDRGRNFMAYVIPGRKGQRCTFDIEQFSGHNVPSGPPPIVRYTRTATDPNLRWRRVNDLELILPVKVDGRLDIPHPILLSRQCIGLSAHSGIPSTVVSRGNKVHVAWGEATDPGRKVAGVPTFVTTYDRQKRRLGKPALVGYGPPPNDVHNSPSITIDSRGFLHVLAGTHGQPFPYTRSLKPNDADGWTEPELVGDGRQTYIGLVCGADDSLHLVFRMWRYSTEPHPLSIHATLAYQRKKPGEPWEEPRVLIVAPFSEYSIFYHRLTIDRVGRLFLSYDYWSTYWFYRTDHIGDRRALLMSPDEGESWKLVETDDVVNNH